jgi:hypothetical protein
MSRFSSIEILMLVSVLLIALIIALIVLAAFGLSYQALRAIFKK